MSGNRSTEQPLIAFCNAYTVLWGSNPNPTVYVHAFLGGRGEDRSLSKPIRAYHSLAQVNQKFSCWAQQRRCYKSDIRMFCTRLYVTLWFSTHSYYAMHLFPRSVTGVKEVNYPHSVWVFEQLVRGLHGATLK